MDIFKSAVILAGGKSSRMGFDKQFLKINEQRLIDVIVDKLENEFEEIIVVTNKKEKYIDSTYKVISDEIKEKGPLSGIHVGLKESSSKYVYFIACDMPNINLEYIRYMKSMIKDINVDACITRKGDKIEPFNGFYSKSIIKGIEDNLLKDKRAIYSLLNNINTVYIDENNARKYSPSWDMFSNLNTIEDLNEHLNVHNGGV